MNQPRVARPKAHARFLVPLGGLALAALASTGCNTGGGTGTGSAPQTGVLTNPGTGLPFFVEANKSGNGPAMKIKGLFWGRLVDVYDTEAATGLRRLQFRDFLIGQDITTDGVDFSLDRNPVTGQQQLTYLHELVTEADYVALRTRLELNLQPVIEKGLGNQPPPFTAIPRNAALAMVLDDLLQPSSVIGGQSIRVLTGNPPSVPFEARVFADPNHGSLVDNQYYPTRVVIDTTVSQLEAQQTSLPVNVLGLPEAPTTTQANVVVRIPTQLNQVVGQTDLLRNLAGKTVSFTGNGPTDTSSLTGDVVRTFRSGISSTDPNNGFLPDEVPPEVIGLQNVSLGNVVPQGGSDYLVDVTFTTLGCATDASVGDVIQTSTVFAEVQGNVQLSGATLASVPVRLLNSGVLSPGTASYLMPFEPGTDVPECFVRFNPPAGILPQLDVDTSADATIRFSEPMDPGTLLPFDTFTIQPSDTTGLSPLEQSVVGQIAPSSDLVEFTFAPGSGLRHTSGTAESYVISLASSVSDLAGNTLANQFGSSSFTLEPSQPTVDTGSVTLKFDSLDEDGNGQPEVSGNFLFDFAGKAILPRPVDRFSAVIDQLQPMIAPMQIFGFPIQTPHSNLGSKMMTVWRYHDVGFGLLDKNTWDLDVEGLNWAPFGGSIQLDNFSQFEIRLSHSNRLPDEYVDPMFLLPTFPVSGLNTTYDVNILDPANSPQMVVHPKNLGYSLQPLDTFPAATGTIMMPWPLNRNVPESQKVYFTWRDTTVRGVGAPNGFGADTLRWYQINGITPPMSASQNIYPPDLVPSIGLPLLMEFRCFPDSSAFGQNGIQIALAVNSSARPFFRIFSTGGVDQSGFPQTVDPDNTPVATGGFNPGAGGAPTPPADNSMHFGQIDFIVRVSRFHTIWFDTKALTGATFAPPVIEPVIQPTGTSVTLAFRGASLVTGAFSNGNNVGAYGDPDQSALNGAGGFSPSYLNNDPTWKSSISAINGAQFFQVRGTFVSNPQSGLTSRLSAMGITFTR